MQAWGGAINALARLRSRSTHEGTQVHPADLDDALCTSAAIASSGGSETRLPFAVDDALLQDAPGVLWAVRSCKHQAISNEQCLITLASCLFAFRLWCVKAPRRSRCGLGLHRVGEPGADAGEGAARRARGETHRARLPPAAAPTAGSFFRR